VYGGACASGPQPRFRTGDQAWEDLWNLVRSWLREPCLHRVAVVYVDLPLSRLATQTGGDGRWELGLISQTRYADVLRLQYLKTSRSKGRVGRLGSGEGLLNLIFE
jgi:hypothetical protein